MVTGKNDEGDSRPCSMVKDSLYVSLEKASDGTQVAPEIPAADESAVGDFLQRETKEMLPSGEEQALRSRYQACTSLPGQVERASHTDSTHDQDVGLDSMSRMPVKRWYEIEFSPTTFHKRTFITQGLESFSPYSHRTETRGREPSLDDKENVTWDIKREDYVETREKESGPPYVQEIVEDLQVQSGDTATFSTVIVGHPAPAVTWYKDGVVLSSSERAELHQQGSRFSLTLVDTSSQDCGVYTCAASNPWGEVSCKAELIVAEGSERSKPERKKRRKLHSLYEVHEEIGRGSFAFVRRVKCKGSGESCAAKFIPLRSSNKAQALQERSVLSQLSHPRLACLLDSFYARRTLVLLTELCSTQTLLDHLLSKESVPEKEVQNYIHQVLEGIDYIHNKNILHLDIKPTNILMALSEKDKIKICDFGFAQEIDLSKPQYSRFGTPEFVAPEIVCQAPVTKATDIWSVGVLSYLCLTGSCLFFGENDRATLKNIQDGRISWDDPDVTSRSPEAQDFLHSVLQLFAEKRPTAAECLRHDWFLGDQSTQEAELINTKKLKFFVSRSKWQCSLKSYGSVMVVRSIPELLEGPFQETSLAVPREQLGNSSSSPSSVSSSDYEDPSCHRETDSMSTPEHLLPAKHRRHPEKSWEVEEESGEGFRTTDHCIELSQSSASDALPEVKKDEHSVLTPRKQILPDQGGVSSEFRLTVCKPGVTEAFRSSESTGSLSHEDSAGSSLSLDISENDATGSTCGRIPRDSLIKSTFYSSSSELSPLSARRMFLQGKKHMKRHERSRKHLMKAGLSGRLQEPLLEQFEESQNEGDDGGNQGRNLLYPPSVIAKSSSFDSGVRVSNSDISMKRRSRSLDEYHTRTPSSSEPIEARRDEGEDLASRVVREDEIQIKLFDSHPEKGVKESTQDDAENTGSFADECTLKESHSERETVQQSELTTEDTVKAETPLSSADSKVESAMLQSVISEMVSLSEEIKVISGFESPPENPVTSEFSLLAYAIQDESTQRTEDSPSSVREPLLMKPIFVESTTPVSAVQEVSELLTSQYGLSEFESPRSFHLSLKALETLEEENRTHFPQLHVAKAKSEMRTSTDPPVLALAAEPTTETPATGGSLSFKEPYGSKYDLQGSFGEPEVIFSTPEEATCVSVPSASHPQEPQVSPEEEFGIFHEHMSETASVKASSRAYMETCGDDDNDLEPELQHLLEEVNMYENLNIAWRDTAFPVKSTSLVEVSHEKQSAEALTEQIHRPSSVPDSKHQPSKTGKYGILRFFRKHSSTDYPTSSSGQGSEMQTPEEKLGHSPSLYQQLQGASNLSLAKKMRASISCLPAAIWGKHRKETDKREGGEEEPHPELGTATSGSLRRKSKLFSFKLHGLKKSREPVFLEELQDMSVSLGQSVTLSCRLSGYPPPDICWYKEGQWIKSSSHIWLSVMDKELHSLTIHAAREEDLGSYRCVASNIVGQASTSCTLIVSELPTCPASPELTQVDGDGVLLVWKPVESIAPLTYNIQYSKDGEAWRLLAEGVMDSCYTIAALPRGSLYRFRVACVNRAGMGPYSDPSAATTIGTDQEDSHIPLIHTVRPREEGSELTAQPGSPFFPIHTTYTFLSEINRGRFSVIKQCREDLSGKLFATKVTPYKAEKRQCVLREYQLLKRLRHTNVVQLHAAFITPRYLVLIEELCIGCELLHHLAERDSYSELHVREFLQQILSAAEYLHSCNVLHLDLKSDNMLVTEHNLLKVVDFGSAQPYEAGKPLIVERIHELTECRAPEILGGQGVGPETDIWSVGVVAFIMLSADNPFYSDIHCERDRNIKKGKIQFGRCYPGLSEGALNFVKRTLHSKPWGRPSAAECLELTWLQGVPVSKRRSSIVCFSTDKLQGYIRDRERKRAQLRTKLDLPIFQ